MTLITYGYDKDGDIYLDNHIILPNKREIKVKLLLDDIDNKHLQHLSHAIKIIAIRQRIQNTRALIIEEDLPREACEQLIKQLPKEILKKNSFMLSY